jgi:ribonuclease P protein component
MLTVGRLKRRPEFLRVAGGRQRWVAPGLILQALRQQATVRGAAAGVTKGTESVSAPRVGFTASAKVGNAVARNRARRRLRAAAAAVLPCHAEPAHDYVLVARAGTLTRRFADLIGDIENGLRHLGLYCEANSRKVGDAA